jgi:hypothetical protein
MLLNALILNDEKPEVLKPLKNIYEMEFVLSLFWGVNHGINRGYFVSTKEHFGQLFTVTAYKV